jgi:periplasmic divalent cation tolerance protein
MTSSAPELCVAWTTVPDLETARSLARGVLAEKLAACVQIDTPVRSLYRWNGQVEETEEGRLWFKAPHVAVKGLGDWIAEHHPYDVPQWVVVTAETSEAYGRWASESVTPG